MAQAHEILTLKGVRKAFPGVVALDDVDFGLCAGEVHALLGENGAGKSTLIKVLTGVHSRDAGTIVLDGKTISPGSTKDAQAAGISTVYQEVNLLENLSVAQNVYLGREPKRFGLIDWKAVKAGARDVLSRFGLDIDVSRPLGSYSVAIQQLVAIARGVDMSARVLILDEPTASLDAGEVEVLFGVLRGLAKDGLGIVFVTHFLDQVYSLSDRITVLRNGKKVGTFETAELPRARLIEHMLGRELQEVAKPHRGGADSERGEVALEADAISVEKSIENVSLTVARGEAVGLAGLLGSGRTETCRALFGLDRLSSGQIRLDGTPLSLGSPREAMRHGIALCPEDRKTAGSVGALSVRENVALAVQARRGWWRPLSRKVQDEMAQRAIAELRIATPDAEKPVGQLSGGNQQKVILARWLATQPRLLLLDEPTRGIDVGAHAEILRLIVALKQGGMALLVTSSELEEMVAFSDRVVVMRDRRKVAELSGEEIAEDSIMRAIAS